MPAPTHVQANTLEKFISGWKTGTAEGMTAVFSDNCIQRTLPFSLNIPTRSREEVGVILPKLMGSLRNYQVHMYIHKCYPSDHCSPICF